MIESEKNEKDITRFPLVGSSTPDVAALVSVIRRLSIVHSMEELMGIVTQAARTLLGADGITFVLRDGDHCHYAEEDALAPLWKGKRFPMSACISGWCMIEGKAAVIPDITKDLRIPQDTYRPTFVKSLAMVPVRQDEPIAAIGAYWAKRKEVSIDEVELLQTVANSAALALAKVTLEQERDKAQKTQSDLNRQFANMLTMIDAMSRQTLRSTNSPEEFDLVFSSRLGALARAQMLLHQDGTSGADLRVLIRDQLFPDDVDSRIQCDGPDVHLSAHEAFDLGLVLHELGANAQKYGALCAAEGRVKITWRLLPRAEGRILNMHWIEGNGPRVMSPVVGGFGTALFRFAFKADGGEMNVRYEPAGIVCMIRIPLA